MSDNAKAQWGAFEESLESEIWPACDYRIPYREGSGASRCFLPYRD